MSVDSTAAGQAASSQRAPAPRPPAETPRETSRRLRPWWALTLVGGAVGMVTSGWQTVDRIAFAANADAPSVCDVNAVLSCSSVFEHWQSSALGVPNSIIALPVFALLAGTGLAGLLGSRLSRSYLATAWGITVGMTVFVTWYMQQSAFDIGVLCLFCAGCAASIVVAGIGITRITAVHQALGGGRTGRGLRALARADADVLMWVGLALLMSVMLFVGLNY